MNVGSLFSGIGGLDLGLERAGMHIRWQCEIDPYCRDILAKHWPDTYIYRDVKDIDNTSEHVDLICGGFPCQPISQARAASSRGEGWMWHEFARVIDDLTPRLVVIENVEALRYKDRGLAWVLSDLADMGFDAEWRVVRASDIGAPHRRARLWVVAYSHSHSKSASAVNAETPILSQPFPSFPDWGSVPDLRVADGVPRRVGQAYGNAVVPAVAEWIGRCVMAA